MWKDPIVEEIHAVRAEISRQCNDDLGEIIAYLRRRQAEGTGRLVKKEDLAKRETTPQEQS